MKHAILTFFEADAPYPDEPYWKNVVVMVNDNVDTAELTLDIANTKLDFEEECENLSWYDKLNMAVQKVLDARNDFVVITELEQTHIYVS